MRAYTCLLAGLLILPGCGGTFPVDRVSQRIEEIVAYLRSIQE